MAGAELDGLEGIHVSEDCEMWDTGLVWQTVDITQAAPATEKGALRLCFSLSDEVRSVVSKTSLGNEKWLEL